MHRRGFRSRKVHAIAERVSLAMSAAGLVVVTVAVGVLLYLTFLT